MSAFVVNNKEPIAVWCPSRDDAGNGSTTLTDLVGSNNGTLVNFALSGSTSNWVPDTDAGGIRALAFDAVNDRVSVSGLSSYASLSFSAWIKLTTFTSGSMIVNFLTTNTVANVFVFSGNLTIRGGSATALNYTLPGGLVNNWVHVVGTISGTTATLFVNGSQVATGTVSAVGNSPSGLDIGAYSDFGGGYYLSGRLDDMRYFSSAIDLSDVAYLYNSGSGRGRIQVATEFEQGMFGGMSGAMTGGMSS